MLEQWTLAGIAAGMVGVIATVAAQQAPPPASAPASAAPMAAVLRDYKPVTSDRLKKPEDSDWLMTRRTYDGWGYSPLSQITPANVKRLQPVWTFATGMANGHEAPPIVNHGVMFVSTPGNQVIAIDAKSGTQLWRYKRPLPANAIVLHPTSRGVALFDDKVFFAAGNAVLVALSARTGEEIWTKEIATNSDGYYMSLAPLIADGKVMIGASGGEVGIRGFVAAFDLQTGNELWRTYTIPAPGEPGERNLAERRRSMEDRRWVGMGDRQLRSRDESGILGHRQWRPMDWRPAPGRQPVYLVHSGNRRGDGEDQGAPSIRSQRVMGLGRGVTADSGGLSTQWQNHQRADRRGARRLSLVSRAHGRQDQLRGREAVRAPERIHQP